MQVNKRSVDSLPTTQTDVDDTDSSLDDDSLPEAMSGEDKRFSEFVGKRNMYEFLGKRYEFVGKRNPYEFVGKRNPYEFLGKRMPYEFIGKRVPYEFIGKRVPYEFIGKRYEFLGKRTPVEDIGKRFPYGLLRKQRMYEFLGKRVPLPYEFVGKRFASKDWTEKAFEEGNDAIVEDGDDENIPLDDIIDAEERNPQSAKGKNPGESLPGKRYSEWLGKRTFEGRPSDWLFRNEGKHYLQRELAERHSVPLYGVSVLNGKRFAEFVGK